MDNSKLPKIYYHLWFTSAKKKKKKERKKSEGKWHRGVKWRNEEMVWRRTIQSCPINQCPEVIRQKRKAQAFSIFRDTRWQTSLVHLCLHLLSYSIIPPGATAPNLIFLSRSLARTITIYFFWILELLFSYLFF